MSDEDMLRQLAREAIGAGRVPAGRPNGTWGGNGTGTVCNLCGLAIPSYEIEFEVEFSHEEAGRAHSYHLHSQCFAAWEFERRAFEAVHSQRLSARGNAGSMPDCERNIKGSGGGESA
jgi:hypothetical protein